MQLANAQGDLPLNYEFYRIDDPLRPMLVYKIVPGEPSGDLRKEQNLFSSLQGPAVFDCNDRPVEIEASLLVATEERCEDKAGGPLTFKIIKAGQSFNVIDAQSGVVGTAMWDGNEFQIGYDEKLDYNAKIVAAFDADPEKLIGIELDYETGSSQKLALGDVKIRVDRKLVDFVSIDGSGGVALSVDAVDGIVQK